MAKVIVSLTMSLDGFIAGPNDDFDHPLGMRDGMMLLADGVRLFEHLGDDSIDLEFVNAVTTPEATHLRYRVKQKGSP